MSEHFDAYHQWLGIPPNEQPPHYYRLLGLTLFETDPQVIANAADRQMSHLKAMATSKHASVAQSLLNELSAAKLCLLRAEKRAPYDLALRSRLGVEPARSDKDASSATSPPAAATPGRPASTQSAPATPARATAASAGTMNDPFGVAESYSKPATSATQDRREKRQPSQKKSSFPSLVGATIGFGLLICAIAAYLLLQDPERLAAIGFGETKKVPTTVPTSTPGTLDSPSTNGKTNSTGETKPPQPNANGKSHPVDQGKVQPDSPQSDPPGNSTSVASPEAIVPVPEVTTDGSASPPDNPVGSAPEELDNTPPVIRHPFPTAKQLSAAELKVRQIMQADFMAAKTPAQRVALAEKLLQTAEQTQDDPLGKLALLNLAKSRALDNGEVTVALRAADLIEQHFEVAPHELRIAALTRLQATATTAEAQRALFSEAYHTGEILAEMLRQEEAYDCFGIATKIARNANDPDLARKVAARARDVTNQKKEFELAKDAIATLETTPDDPAANLAVARWYLEGLGDRPTAIKHLARSSNPALKKLAEQELANPSESTDQIELAKQWETQAGVANSPVARIYCEERAMYWYQRAAAKAVGLAKSELESKIKAYSVKVNELREAMEKRRSPQVLSKVPHRVTGSYRITVYVGGKYASQRISLVTPNRINNENGQPIGTWKQFGTGLQLKVHLEKQDWNVTFDRKSPTRYETPPQQSPDEPTGNLERDVVTGVWTVHELAQPNDPPHEWIVYQDNRIRPLGSHDEYNWTLQEQKLNINSAGKFDGTYTLNAEKDYFSGRSAQNVELHGYWKPIH
ncbi:MAG: hypothetical protein SGJ20_14730 [Planctomycetota bacterium]|nr:hypothetical protein [Planctomycetota bacterium]